VIISNKVFVVTGGGAGIGQDVVLALVNRGARVAAVDISETGLGKRSPLPAGTLTGSPLTSWTSPTGQPLKYCPTQL
jgi:hypothetical protein